MGNPHKGCQFAAEIRGGFFLRVGVVTARQTSPFCVGGALRLFSLNVGFVSPCLVREVPTRGLARTPLEPVPIADSPLPKKGGGGR